MSKKFDKLIIGDLPMTGPVNIDTDWLILNWDDKCFLTEWVGDESKFRFIRYRRLGQQTTTHKFTIHNEDANKLISALKLIPEKSIFNSAFTWKTFPPPNQSVAK